MKHYLILSLIIVAILTTLVGCWQPGSNPTAPPLQPTQFPILVYHHIMTNDTGDPSNDDLFCDTTTFDREMSYLSTNAYTSISFDDLVAHFENSKSLPTKSVIISFDDGWATQMQAVPILQKYGFKATFFIIVEAVASNPDGNANANPVTYDGITWTSWNTVGWDDHYVTWPDVKTLDSDGMFIGCHTMTHPDLTSSPYINAGTLESDPSGDNLTYEVVDSKAYLENFLGHSVNAFAYPYGLYNSTVINALKTAGYTSARTTSPGTIQATDTDKLFTLTCLLPATLSDVQNYIETQITKSSANEVKSLLMKNEFIVRPK